MELFLCLLALAPPYSQEKTLLAARLDELVAEHGVEEPEELMTLGKADEEEVQVEQHTSG